LGCVREAVQADASPREYMLLYCCDKKAYFFVRPLKKDRKNYEHPRNDPISHLFSIVYKLYFAVFTNFFFVNYYYKRAYHACRFDTNDA
jgi:hypothetical protein